MTDVDTLLNLQGRSYDRDRIEARAAEIAEKFALNKEVERIHYPMPSRTDLEILRDLQEYSYGAQTFSWSVAIFTVLVVLVTLGGIATFL